MPKGKDFDVGDKIWIEVEVQMFIDDGQTAIYTTPRGGRDRIDANSDQIKKVIKGPEWVPPPMR